MSYELSFGIGALVSRRVAFSLGVATDVVALSGRCFFAAVLLASFGFFRALGFTFFRAFVPELEEFAERVVEAFLARSLGTGFFLPLAPARFRFGERILALAATVALLGRPGASFMAAA